MAKTSARRIAKRSVTVTAGSMLAFGLMASPAFAGHCYVVDKPSGAGAVTPDDLFVNAAGKLIAPGAFVDGSVFGTPDLFIRGPVPLPPGAPPITGSGSLPEQPHHNGSEDHGVQAVEFPAE